LFNKSVLNIFDKSHLNANCLGELSGENPRALHGDVDYRPLPSRLGDVPMAFSGFKDRFKWRFKFGFKAFLSAGSDLD
jgi:hypothetical protein